MADCRRVVIVHTLDHALAALAAASELHRSIVLQSAPYAWRYAGSLYLLEIFKQSKAQYPHVDAVFVLDCNDAGGDTVSAMQVGHTHIRSNAAPAIQEKLADIAVSLHVVFISGEYQSLDLLLCRNPHSACREWLQALE